MRELSSKPLELDVFDDDVFSSDEKQGTALLDLAEICHRAPRPMIDDGRPRRDHRPPSTTSP
eukprot:4546473-Prymnesium_polylepis.1